MATPPAPARPGGIHYGYAIALLAGLAVFAAFGFGRLAYGLLLPAMKAALSMNYTEGSALAFANLAVYIVAAPVAGALSARYGPRRVVFGALLVLVLAFLGLYSAPNYWTAFAFFGLTGLGSGLAIIPSLGIVSGWFAPRRRGVGLGITLAGPPACFILTGIFVPQLVTADPVNGWRDAWLIFAGASLLVAVIVGLLLRNRPADIGLEPVGGPIARPAGVGRGIRGVVGIRALWLLSAVYTCFGVAYVIYATFLPSYTQQERGLAASSVGQLWIVIGVAALFGPLTFGWLSDRIGRRYGLALLLFLLGLALMSLILVPDESGPWISAVAYGFVMVAVVGVASAACGDYAGPALAPAAIGFVTTFLGVGQALGPMIAGPVADLTGSFVPSIVVSAGVSGLGALIALFLPKPSPAAGAVPAHPPGVPIRSRTVPGATVPPPPIPREQPVMNLPENAQPPFGSATADAPATSPDTAPPVDWRTWARQTVTDETNLAADLSAWAERTADGDLAEILEIAAARARDRAYSLRRQIRQEGGGEVLAPPRPTVDTTWLDGGLDLDLIDRLLDRPPRYQTVPGLDPLSPETALIGQLRQSETETIELLQEQRQRLGALADRRRIRVIEGEPVEGVGGGIAYWKVLRPAGGDSPTLARISQMPGTCLRLPPAPAPRIVVWQDGTGDCRAVEQPGISLAAGQVAEISAGAPAEIAATGDWPATYLVISNAPLPLPDSVPAGPALDEVRGA